jgi:phosphate transport system permease protein
MSNGRQQRMQQNLAGRHRAEARFRFAGFAAVGAALLMLGYLLFSIVAPGISGFTRYEVRLDITLTKNMPVTLEHAYNAMVQAVKGNATSESELRDHLRLLGTFAAHDVARAMREHPGDTRLQVWVPVADNADQFFKGRIDPSVPAAKRPLGNADIKRLQQWQRHGHIRAVFNAGFFTQGDSRSPEAAGFFGAMVGSLFTVLACMLVAVPVALLAAIYLEEFAPKNRFTEALEICINNLAAVPSILFGLLGLSIYLNLFGMPRSAPLVGGLTLALLVMPVLIIAARGALKAVPPSMRQAAMALGASPLQAVMHHVVPYAMPGVLTGCILAMSRAIGETAPLLMIGMMAFVADIPRGALDPASVMPVQIYVWASSPELGFIEKTSSGIMVLLVLLLMLNLVAIWLRNRFEKRW